MRSLVSVRSLCLDGSGAYGSKNVLFTQIDLLVFHSVTVVWVILLFDPQETSHQKYLNSQRINTYINMFLSSNVNEFGVFSKFISTQA